MAKAQHVDDDHSLSPAEYFIKYCVDENIGRSLSVLKASNDCAEGKSKSEFIDNTENNSLNNDTVKQVIPLFLTEEFRMHASNNQWATRKGRGFARSVSIFDFLLQVYQPWIERGMTRADLRKVDFQAWQALQNALKRQPMPENLRLPKQCDASLPEPGTKAYERIMRARELNRARMRLLNGA